MFPPVVWSDNTSVVALSENPIHYSKIKHVKIDMFFIREKVHSRKIIVNFVTTNEQVADILTKHCQKCLVFYPYMKKLKVFSVE